MNVTEAFIRRPVMTVLLSASFVVAGLLAYADIPIAALPRTAPEFGFCHGDLHPGNVCFAADGRPTLFDFDCAGWGWRSYDLTIFFWNAFGERRPKRWREGRWRAFLRGYQEVRPLDAAEKESLPVLARGSALRFMHTRLYDWLTIPDGALVQTRDPVEYIRRLRFHRTIKSASEYGLK